MHSDEDYLKMAKKLAAKSPESVGCGVVLVVGDKILAKAFNSQNTDNIAIFHAEIKAIYEANKMTGNRKLIGSTAFCSCEPCAMCLSALSYAKVDRIVFDKTMKDLFPDDPQSKLDPYEFVKQLNFSPEIIHLKL